MGEGRGGAPARGEVVDAPVRRFRGGVASTERDLLAVEAPLEIRLGSESFTVLMRTPGADEELVTGFLVSEGIVASAEAIRALSRPESLVEGDCDNFLAVELVEPGAGPATERRFFASASCGVCGKSSIADLEIRAEPVASGLVFPAGLVEALPERLRAAQPAFAETGGLHGAALFDGAGELLAAREDIGRHNAVDKLIGWAARNGRLPLTDAVLAVSGRLGFEIAQKAIVAGIPIVVSVGAASSVAVALAERYGLTLATFVRAGSMNLYGRTERVRLPG
ncbi:MAG: formate dehydrogenase accessory sulfurtransferase FdhD [Thermoanaerobaculia bacterium]